MPRAVKPVTLSFDNGPTPGITDKVLDILAGHACLTTFFVVGEKVRASKEASRLIDRAHAAGHWIGNHSDTHDIPFGTMDPPEEACDEIHDAQRTIGTRAHPDRLFRPFGGGGKLGPALLNRHALALRQQEKYSCIIWNSIPRDWPVQDNTHHGWVERAQAQIMEQNWPLVVLHDIEGACLERLDQFLSWLRAGEFEVRQEFPPDCVLLERGTIRPGVDIDRFVSG